MFLNCHSAIERKSLRVNWRPCKPALLVGAFTLCLLPLSTVSAQMGQYSVYSDEWVDTSNPDALAIVGCGVTQDNQNYYGHTYWVVTKVTSPSGRTASSTSYHSSSYARVETHLPWDWDDPGDYLVETRHWMCCPYMGGNPNTGQNCYPSGNSSQVKPYGISRAQYVVNVQYGDATGEFVPIANCNVACAPSSFTDQLHCPEVLEYRLRLQLWGTAGFVTVCIPGTTFYVSLANCSQQLAQCYDAPY